MKKLALVCLLGACGLEEESIVESDLLPPIDPTCDEWGCGHNTARGPDGVAFDEFDRRGLEWNRAGSRIESATLADGTPVAVWVDRHFLMATSKGGHVYDHTALVGMTITIKHKTRGRYQMQLTAYDDTSMLFWPDAAGAVPAPPTHEPAPDEVPFYEFKVRRVDDPDPKFKHFVCGDDTLRYDPTWSRVAHMAVVFQWDRFNPAEKTITQTALDDPWFNIACANTYPAKMFLQRYTHSGNFDTVWDPTGTVRSHVQVLDITQDRRRAMLKNLTADYCGGERSYTEHGVPLHWRESYFNYRSTPHELWDPGVSLEAIWGPTGAVCLSTPRRYARAEVTCAASLFDCREIPPWFPLWWWGTVISAKIP